jgi:hypothetical protein
MTDTYKQAAVPGSGDIPIPDISLNNCYVTVNGDDIVIDTWTDAQQKDRVPTDADILVYRTWRSPPCLKLDGEEKENPDIETPDGAHKYRYDREHKKIALRTFAELAAEVEALRLAALPGQVREVRDMLLAASDWTQLADTALTPDEVAEWAVYRQGLRDITKSPGFPEAVVMPAEPE